MIHKRGSMPEEGSMPADAVDKGGSAAMDPRLDSALNTGVAKREVWAWAMYDFANSGFTTVVLTTVFSVYFVGVVADGKSWGTLAFTAALSLRSEEHTSELQSLMRISYAVFCLKKKNMYRTLQQNTANKCVLVNAKRAII